MEDTSKQEILSAVNAGFQTLSDRIDSLSGRVDGFSGQVDGLSGRMDGVESNVLEAVHLLADEVENLSKRTTRIESSMVTKSYLDRKLTELRRDLILMSQKSNTKLSVLVERLVKEGSLKKSAADLILAMEPFAQ